MPHQKKKQADMSAFNPEAEFIIRARNMESTITAEDRTAMQNARQRHLQGVGNHEPSFHVVVPNPNNLPNARQGGFLNRLETAVDAALTPDRPEGNRLLDAATLFLHNTTPSITAPVTQQTNPTDDIDDGELIVDVDDTIADTATDIIEEARTRPQQRPQQRRNGRLSSTVRLARQQSNRQRAVVIDPNIHRELLNLNKAKKNRRSERVLKTRMMEATRFILFLHSHHPELVQSDLHAQLIVASSAQYTFFCQVLTFGIIFDSVH